VIWFNFINNDKSLEAQGFKAGLMQFEILKNPVISRALGLNLTTLGSDPSDRNNRTSF